MPTAAQKLAHYFNNQFVVFELRQAGDGHGSHHADISHDDRKRAAVRRVMAGIQPRRLLEGGTLARNCVPT